MKLSNLLKGFLYQILQGDESIEITGLSDDSRNIAEGNIFVCIRGFEYDGHRFLDESIQKGSVCVVIDEKCLREDFPEKITVLKVWNPRKALAKMAAAYYGYPAAHMRIIGITGTKGKTTTAHMIWTILQEAGYETGRLGTIGVYNGKEIIPSANTTPDALELQKHLSDMRMNGCKFVVMEVSSQALMLERTAGIIFDTAVFTNIGEDHIGKKEHQSMEEYLHCKSLLFERCRFAVLNGDDPHWKEMLKNAECEYVVWGKNEKRYDYTARHLTPSKNEENIGMEFDVEKMDSKTPDHMLVCIPGEMNVQNALAAISVADHYEIPWDMIKNALIKTKVEGRSEVIPLGEETYVMVDYAHNSLGLENILKSLKEYHPRRIVCVFGCGGGRSKTRRASMGFISGQYADLTIITSDNPRNENPKAIMKDIENGICRTGGKYIMIEDRKRAITYAIKQICPGDIVLIAGKGHEAYQEINGVQYPLNDREIAEGAINVCRYNY